MVVEDIVVVVNQFLEKMDTFVNRKLPERMVRLGVQHRLFLAEVPAI